MANVTGSLLGGVAGSTIPTIATYPGGQIYAPTPVHPFNNPIGNHVGSFRIRRVENGFVIEVTHEQWGTVKEYFAEDLKAAGERITASCVANELKGAAPTTR